VSELRNDYATRTVHGVSDFAPAIDVLRQVQRRRIYIGIPLR
jgi:hypothetical protein